MILAGDFGGTNCRLALIKESRQSHTMIVKERYRCEEFETAYSAIRHFLSKHRSPRVSRICFAVAGPVFNGSVKFVHLNWSISTIALKMKFAAKSVLLVNDLVATLYGIDTLADRDLYIVQQGRYVERAPRAVIGIGTGMNEMVAYWDRRAMTYLPIPSESGHADFAPRTNIEIEFLQWLRRRRPIVSWESVLTGTGLESIHAFLEGSSLKKCDHDNKAEVISKNARLGNCHICRRALKMWASMLGAESGNATLRGLARGGVFLDGSVARAGLYRMGRRSFVGAFRKKAKLDRVLSQVPVRLILNDQVPLLGATYLACNRRHDLSLSP